MWAVHIKGNDDYMAFCARLLSLSVMFKAHVHCIVVLPILFLVVAD